MKKLWVENIENPAAVYAESAPNENYVDKTNDAVQWFYHGEQVMDYWFVLGKIKNILIPKANPNYPTLDFTGWGTLTNDERYVMAKLTYAPYVLRVPTIFTDEQDIENARTLLIKSYGIEKQYYNQQIKGRLKVVEEMRQHVFINYVRKNLMTLDTSKQFGVDTCTMLDEFERFANNNFYNWLTNAVGSVYEINGFAQKSYYSDQLKSELLTIYNGE